MMEDWQDEIQKILTANSEGNKMLHGGYSWDGKEETAGEREYDVHQDVSATTK